jgi:hypothetical protein
MAWWSHISSDAISSVLNGVVRAGDIQPSCHDMGEAGWGMPMVFSYCIRSPKPMPASRMQKIEEWYLYMIMLKKENEELRKLIKP